MSKPSKRSCDVCNRRLRPNQHELHLSDPLTGQIIGKYHTREECMEAAQRYITGALGKGRVCQASVVHPDRCGSEIDRCDAGAEPGDAA